MQNINIIKKSKSRCFRFRKRLLEISQKVSALHVGGGFSCTEVMDLILNHFQKKNDKFILSKGHSAIMLYVMLEFNKILKKKDLDNYCKKNGLLGVHPEIHYPGVVASTGSLGHGIGIAAGMSLSKKFDNIYILISDGELMEGSTWENVLLISSMKLNNIILVVDNNDLQSATRATDTHPTLYPIDQKFKSFGWEVKNCNGHNIKDIYNKIKNRKKNKPFALIAKTIKGFPVSFMKNKPIWHYRSPSQVEYTKALTELKKYYER